MLSVANKHIMLRALMLSIVMLSVIMLNVAAPTLSVAVGFKP
jgi:hypothetical protein